MDAKDILVTNNENIIIADGDFKIGTSDAQHVRHLLKAYPGQYRLAPLVGVGIMDRLNGPRNSTALESVTRRNLEDDGYLVIRVQSVGDGLDVNAQRIR